MWKVFRLMPRQFLGRMNKPEVDFIKGLPPAIAIEQRVNTRNPRSTVGTSTEIYDYLKFLVCPDWQNIFSGFRKAGEKRNAHGCGGLYCILSRRTS